MVTVYGMRKSGNCYKVALLLAQLGQACRWVDIDSMHGETRTPEFLARNLNGRVPLLQLESGEYLPESNAILHYLAAGSSLWPKARLAQAQALQWMFFEQYSHEPYIAVARVIQSFLPPTDPRRAELPRLQERGNAALDVMQQHLATRAFLLGADYSIADIALYAYTHCAADGGFDLGAYPAVVQWLARIAHTPGFILLGSIRAASA